MDSPVVPPASPLSTMTGILILTNSGDVHACAVHEALRRKGVHSTLWLTSDYPTIARETIAFRGRESRVSIRERGLDLGDVRASVVWNRRPSYVVDNTLLHPADREFVDLQCKAHRDGLFALLRRAGFWVNDRDAAVRANHKPLQHAMAVECGLEMPDTLYTNDPAEIRAFIREHGGRIVFKPFHIRPWTDGRKNFITPTTVIGEEHLHDETRLGITPAIYQELVPKAYELRVTAIGERLFAAKLHSQQTEHGRVDWRRAQEMMTAEETKLPRDVEEKCRELLARLGLVFGALDLIATPDGRHVFLEVNQMGQFLFVERWTGMPLLDAFAEMLRQGTAAYTWPAADRVGYDGVMDQTTATWQELSRTHVQPRDRVWDERPAGALEA
jgi:glutathione synthase/RimK-type ligase-like ATP-grasp enzyme